MTCLSRLRHRLSTHATLALVLLGLGTIVHFGHHLLDPACADGRQGSTPCACAAMHGAAISAGETAVAPISTPLQREIVEPANLVVTTSVPARCAPRAPPLA